MSAKVIREQEKRLISAQSDVETSRSELRLAEKSARESKMNEESARHELKDALRELKESREVLSENQRVITWLNRQLNDAKMEKENNAITRKSYVAAHDFTSVAREVSSSTVLPPSSTNKPPTSKIEEDKKTSYDLGPPYEDILLGNNEVDDDLYLYGDDFENDHIPDGPPSSSSSCSGGGKRFGDLPTDAFGLSVRATLESSEPFVVEERRKEPLGVSAVLDSNNQSL
jgi:hypothetical protein